MDDEAEPATREFVRLRFRGGRFEADVPGLPVEVLDELALYRDLVLSVAKQVFLSRHPQRLRVPKNFADQLGLRLCRIEGGSVTPLLERPSATAPTLGEDEFEESRRLIDSVFENAATNEPLPAEFPDGSLNILKAFARRLQPDEMIEFLPPGVTQGAGVTYDRSKRTDLLTKLASRDEPYEGTVRVVGLQTESATVTFREESGGTFTGRYADGMFVTLREALDPQAAGPRFLLQGVVALNINGSIRNLSTIESVENIEAVQIAYDRLQGEIEDIPTAEGGALQGVSNRAQQLLGHLRLEYQPPPTRAYATGEDGVRLEWHLESKITSVDLEEDGTVEFVSTTRGNPALIRVFGTVAELIAVLDDLAEAFDVG